MLKTPCGTYYEPSEVAEILGVSPMQVIRYCDQGLLEWLPDGKAGRGVRRKIPASALEGFERPKPGPKPQEESQITQITEV